MSALLVVDWDFFFPMPHDDPQESIYFYDWGHSEHWSPALLNVAWASRAAQFIRCEKPLPACVGWEDWWQRFDIDPEATLTYANSNVQALSAPDGNVWSPYEFEAVWLYDAHHDSGYGHTPENLDAMDTFTCEDWLVYFSLNGVETHVRYPRWHALWTEVEPEPDLSPFTRMMDAGNDDLPWFTHVMVCRSDSWVPPWCDQDFQAFIDSCPVAKRLSVDGTASEPRAFDLQEVTEYAAAIKQAMEATKR